MLSFTIQLVSWIKIPRWGNIMRNKFYMTMSDKHAVTLRCSQGRKRNEMHRQCTYSCYKTVVTMKTQWELGSTYVHHDINTCTCMWTHTTKQRARVKDVMSCSISLELEQGRSLVISSGHLILKSLNSSQNYVIQNVKCNLVPFFCFLLVWIFEKLRRED